MSGNHSFTYAEEYNACLHYLWCVFEYSGEDDLDTVVDMLSLDMPHVDRDSLKTEMQGIKAVALDEGLEDHLDFSAVSNKSLLTRAAFRAATDDYGILKDKYDGGLSGTISREELQDIFRKDRGEDETIIIADDEEMDVFSRVSDEIRFEELMEILKGVK